VRTSGTDDGDIRGGGGGGHGSTLPGGGHLPQLRGGAV